MVESPGTIALPTSEVGRFAMFTLSLAALRQPEHSIMAVHASASVTHNLNEAAKGMLAREDHEWFFILGDDHVFINTILFDMLNVLDEEPEIDILVPLIVRRNPPFALGIFHETGQTDDDGIPLFRPYAFEELPVGDHQIRVDAAGNAGMLMRRHVVERMTAEGEPLFFSTPDKHGRQAVLNEDVTFCTRARKEFDFTICATTQAFMGHLGVYNVRPMCKGDQWGSMVEFSATDDHLKELFMPPEANLIVVP